MPEKIYIAVAPNNGECIVVDEENPIDFYEVTAEELQRIEEDGWGNVDKVLVEKDVVHVWPPRS